MPNGNDEWSQYARPAKDEWQQYARPAKTEKPSLFEQGRQAFEAKGGDVGMPGSFEGKPENVGEYVPQTIGNVASGVGNLAEGNIARGTHQILSGGMNALLAAAPFVAVTSPLGFGIGAAGSYLGGKAARKGSQLFRASPDVQDVAEDVGSIVGGSPALFKTPPARSLLVNAAGEPRLPTTMVLGKGRAEAIADFFNKPKIQAAADAAELQQRRAAYAEMNEDFAKRSADAAKAQAKADKLQAKAQATADKAAKAQQADILKERQKRAAAYAEMQQDFASRPTEQPLVQLAGEETPTPRRGSIAPPPAPAEPNTSLLSANKTVVQPGQEPIPGNQLHQKLINIYQTKTGPELRALAASGDRFAAFVLRTMPRK